jgi:hypothetical protein
MNPIPKGQNYLMEAVRETKAEWLENRINKRGLAEAQRFELWMQVLAHILP